MGEFRNWLEDFATARTPLGTQMRDFRTKSFSPISKLPVDVWGRQFPEYTKGYKCNNCGYMWTRGDNLGKPAMCPKCGSFDIKEINHGSV